MDISYLLFLQNFRASIHDAWTPFLEHLSLFAVTYLIFIPVFIYWCVDKRKGLFTLASYAVSVMVTAVLKLTACIYRPWIRDARILPAGDAITTATGYSFPSGHTTTATPIYGAMAVGFWDKKSTRWLSILCIVLILLTGFSRNYLGVHTPQDVAVGFLVGIAALVFVSWLFRYLEKNPQQEDKFLLGGFILCVLAFIYIVYKPYPMDYIDGKLVVDPQKMMNDGFKDIAVLASFCVGRFIEKRWVRFQATGLTVKGIVFGLVGLVPLYCILFLLKGPFINWMGPHWGRAAFVSLAFIYILALYPWVLKYLCPPKKTN